MTLCGSVWALDTTGLVAYWNFDEGSGVTAYDSIGGYNGTLVGDPVWVSGIDGTSALECDGVDDYVDTPLVLDLSDAWAVCIWIKSNEMTPGGIFNLGGSYESGKIRIESRNDYDYGGFRFRYSSDPPNSVIGTPVVNEGGWHHIVWQQESGAVGSIYNVYVDGDIVRQNNVPTAKYANINFRIAQEARYGCYNGTIDEVLVFNRMLSAEEVNDLYTHGIVEPNLTGLEIEGPNEVAEESSAQYRAIAVYDNNSTEDVTDEATMLILMISVC